MRLFNLILVGLVLLLSLAPGAMATRAAIEPITAVQNSYAGFAWDALATAGHYYNATNDGKQLLIVNTTTTATAYVQNVTVVAGEFWRAELGDILFQLPTNHTYVLGPFESSWVKQYNGTVLIDTNATRGSIALINLP